MIFHIMKKPLDMGFAVRIADPMGDELDPEALPEVFHGGDDHRPGPLPTATSTLVLSMVQRAQVPPRKANAALRKTCASKRVKRG